MAKVGALMGILMYWIFLALIFLLPGSPFSDQGFEFNSTIPNTNSSGSVPVLPPDPGLVDYLAYFIAFLIYFGGIIIQLFALIVFGIGLPASFPLWVQLIFSFFNFFVFIVAVGISASFLPGGN